MRIIGLVKSGYHGKIRKNINTFGLEKYPQKQTKKKKKKKKKKKNT